MGFDSMLSFCLDVSIQCAGAKNRAGSLVSLCSVLLSGGDIAAVRVGETRNDHVEPLAPVVSHLSGQTRGMSKSLAT